MVGIDTVDAYLAGAIDIDGHISIIRKRGYRRRTDGRQMTYYVATVSLSDASPVVPDLLAVDLSRSTLKYRARIDSKRNGTCGKPQIKPPENRSLASCLT